MADKKIRIVKWYDVKFYGREGNTKIKKSQIEQFHAALGIVVEE